MTSITHMPKVSVIIPTCNRPALLARAIRSVLAQTYQDFEIIVVDDGDKVRVKDVVEGLHDPRIVYVVNDPPRQGGGKSRNVGIARARGTWVAFQDDDDEWLSEKLAIQMEAFTKAPEDVGFCFTAVVNIFSDHEETTQTEDGVFDFSQIVLSRFKGFLTSTLVVRKTVLDEVGGFDKSLPSHQEPELIIRITRKYRGIGINKPLVRMNMTPHDHIGGSLEKKIRGREMLIVKHAIFYEGKLRLLARHYFQLGLWCRDCRQQDKAKAYFWKAFSLTGNLRYFWHFLFVSYKKLHLPPLDRHDNMDGLL